MNVVLSLIGAFFLAFSHDAAENEVVSLLTEQCSAEKVKMYQASTCNISMMSMDAKGGLSFAIIDLYNLFFISDEYDLKFDVKRREELDNYFIKNKTAITSSDIKKITFDKKTLSGSACIKTDYGFECTLIFRCSKDPGSGALSLETIAIQTKKKSGSDSWEFAYYLCSGNNNVLAKLETPEIEIKFYGTKRGHAREIERFITTDVKTRKTLQKSGCHGVIEYYPRYKCACHKPEFMDINMDGTQDILIHTGCGAQNHCYMIMLWNPKTCKYEYEHLFSEYINGVYVKTDPKTKKIECGWHMSASECPKSVYTVKDGILCDEHGEAMRSQIILK